MHSAARAHTHTEPRPPCLRQVQLRARGARDSPGSPALAGWLHFKSGRMINGFRIDESRERARDPRINVHSANRNAHKYANCIVEVHRTRTACDAAMRVAAFSVCIYEILCSA